MTSSLQPLIVIVAVLAFAACTTSAPSTTLATVPGEPSAGTSLQLSQPQTLANQKPEYPALARRLGQKGKVVVRVHVDVNGRPSQATVSQSSGHPMLDKAAVESVFNWTFMPGRRKGVIEPMWFNVPITFSLNSDGVSK